MKIATFNINGVKARIEGLTKWLEDSAPDVAVLQEIKSVDEGFPRQAIEDLGYNVETHGQKGFNGVAILRNSRSKMSRGDFLVMMTMRKPDGSKRRSLAKKPCAFADYTYRTAIPCQARNMTTNWLGWTDYMPEPRR